MKRGIIYYASNLMLIDRNSEWLKSDISLKRKLLYYPSIIVSYVRMPLKTTSSIKYLGKDFVFDNPATPLNLQNYPYEITKKILANMETRPKSVLDIGGNIGHFSVTLRHVLGSKAHIDVFEPNKEIFPMLEKNISNFKNVKAFNYGLGEKTHKQKMFYESGRSGTGSLIRENASDQDSSISETTMDMISSVTSITKKSAYDLLKIDVEGYEFEALKALKDVKTKYLFIELSSSRSKSYAHSQLFSLVAKQFGQFDIVYASPVSKSATTFDALLRFHNPKA